MKDFYMIGGPMGVGKTTACQELKKKLKNSVFLDGDWCWNSNPWIVTDETKAMVLDNICSVLERFIKCSAYEHIIFCWVMHDQSIIDTIISRLSLENCRVHKISLVCKASELKRRLMKDVRQGIRHMDCMENSLSRLCLYDGLDTYKLDVSNLSAQETADKIMAYVRTPLFVSFEGNFWSRHHAFAATREIVLNRPFQWGKEQWCVFSAHIFPKGIVLDYGFSLEALEVKKFFDQWRFIDDKEEALSEDEAEQIEQTHPLRLTVRPQLLVNGRPLHSRQSCSAVWIPDVVTNKENDPKVSVLLEHYGMDKARAWCVYRTSFEWNSGFCQQTYQMVDTLLLKLEAEPKMVTGPHFTTPGDENEVLIKSPVDDHSYTLKILECCPQKLPADLRKNEKMDFPEHFWQLNYAIDPPISPKKMSIQDCDPGDSPRFREKETYGAAAVAVIGASRRCASRDTSQKSGEGTVFSSPHFSPVSSVEWKTVFYTLDRSPIQIIL